LIGSFVAFGKLTPGLGHLQKAGAVLGVLGLLRQRNAFRAIAPVRFSASHAEPSPIGPSTQNFIFCSRLHGAPALSNRSSGCAVAVPNRMTLRTAMNSPKQYRQNAADCRRIAETMKGEDRKTLLKIAEAWERQAQEAEKRERKDS
jgi:hypothetical protein